MKKSLQAATLLRTILAAKKTLLVSFVASIMTLPVQAGIPVIDSTNVVQATISAVNNVQAVAKQMQISLCRVVFNPICSGYHFAR